MPATEIELYEGASARFERAGTIGLVLKYSETWGCRRVYLANLGVPDSDVRYLPHNVQVL